MKIYKPKKLPVSVIILAGGKGERIGGNKLFLSVDGKFLVESLIEKMSSAFDEVLLCIGNGECEKVKSAFYPLLKFYSVKIVEDRRPGRGPIEGLYSGLNAMNNEWGFLFGCDMPNPQEAVIHYMWNRTVELSEEHKVSVACIDNHLMPLHAFYHKDCSYFINSLIEYVESECDIMEDDDMLQSLRERKGFNRRLRLKSFYDRTKVIEIDESELAIIPGWRKSFAGFNTVNELKSALSL